MDAVLDMVCPLFLVRTIPLRDLGDSLCIPDASYNKLVCIAAIAPLHCSKINESGIPHGKGRRNPAAFGISDKWGLFRRLLPRRVERAGIVDFGHLVIGEAENLAQDFVGVLAKQRRTGHIAGAVRQLDRVAD